VLSFTIAQQLVPNVCVWLKQKIQNVRKKKRTTTNSSKVAPLSLEEELNPSNLLNQGEEVPDPNLNQPRPNQEATAADELAKIKKRLLVVQQEADAAKEIQRQKVEIAKLNKELRIIKAKQSLNFN
jgi:hypothetical protein